MPRRDGFPTNPEMIADFTEISRQLFVEAFDREIENGMHPAYVDKPLSMLTLDVPTIYSAKSGTRMTSERLSIEPLGDQHIAVIELSERAPDREILDMRRQMASIIGETTLQPDIAIGDVLQPGNVVADYQVCFTSGRISQVGTLMDRPAKIVIAGALSAAEAGLQYVGNGVDTEDGLTALLGDANRRLKYSERILEQQTWTQFDLRMDPNLPLNGHESTGFLRKYHGRMRESALRHAAQVERLKALGFPLADQVEQEIALCTDAKARAKQLLEERGQEA